MSITLERVANLSCSAEDAIETRLGAGPARLLAGDQSRPQTLAQHRLAYPPPPPLNGAPWRILHRLVGEAGLTGRGGAGFPTARKLEAVVARGCHTVVANGTEGEPASRKDVLLMTRRPHLVLDGALLAACAAGAVEVVLCLSRQCPAALTAVNAALAERAAAGEDVGTVRVVAAPPRYVAGEETALVSWLNGGSAKPSGNAKRPFESGVGKRPTLVQNVETLANLPLIAKNGAAWYRGCGTPDEPGTRLVTVAVAPGRHVVLEAECGAPLGDLLSTAGIPGDRVQAVLVGGLYGTWVAGSTAAAGRLSRSGLAPCGASPGAGILIPVPWAACGLAETARILQWYAAESAGQCGPCRFGLPDLAALAGAVADGRAQDGAVATIDRYSREIEGRGACRLPDGAVRLLRSARIVFAADFARHLAGERCREASAPSRVRLPVPAGEWR